jgi:carboxypeptidase PM20D1
MKRFLLLLGSVVVLIVAVMLVRTLRYRSDQVGVRAVPEVAVRQGAAERLAGAVRIPTISHEDSAAFDAAAFQRLHVFLQREFARVHSQLRREVIGTHSLLYTWQGTNPSLKPVLLRGHLDVVPVEPGTEGNWRESPFSGRIVTLPVTNGLPREAARRLAKCFIWGPALGGPAEGCD